MVFIKQVIIMVDKRNVQQRHTIYECQCRMNAHHALFINGCKVYYTIDQFYHINIRNHKDKYLFLFYITKYYSVLMNKWKNNELIKDVFVLLMKKPEWE